MPLAAAGREDILFEDFEAPLRGWTVKGEAFAQGPVAGTLPNQQAVAGYTGQRLLNSYLGGDSSRGTLTSPPFTISRRYIQMLIGGGNKPWKCEVRLLVKGKVCRTATGHDSEKLLPTWMEVGEWEGQSARLEVVDDATDGWGHILVDGISFIDDIGRDGDAPRWHIETAPARRVRYDITYTYDAEDYVPAQWRMIAMEAPVLFSQDQTTTTISLEGSDVRPESRVEGSPLKRRYLLLAIPANRLPTPTRATHTITYEARLLRRSLSAGPPASPPLPLPPEEREAALQPTRIFDFNHPEFRAWLARHGLHRRPDESALTLAWRVGRVMAATLGHGSSGGFSDGCIATNVLAAGKSGCGGHQSLFVSAMRANGIPAIERFGRFVTADCWVHAEADFYDDQMGWVAAGPGGAIGNPDKLIEYLGSDPGDFLTFHTDFDMKLPLFRDDRLENVTFMQFGACWDSSGRGFKGGETRSSGVDLDTSKPLW
jgi:hypothetical protein